MSDSNLNECIQMMGQSYCAQFTRHYRCRRRRDETRYHCRYHRIHHHRSQSYQATKKNKRLFQYWKFFP